MRRKPAGPIRLAISHRVRRDSIEVTITSIDPSLDFEWTDSDGVVYRTSGDGTLTYPVTVVITLEESS